MTATPYPIPRETRETTNLVGAGTTGPYGPTSFKVFDIEDIVVWARAEGADRFADVTAGVTVTKTADLPLDTVSVTFDDAVPATTAFRIQSRRTAERSLAITKGGTIDAGQLEKELSKIASAISELRRDIDLALRADIGSPAPALPAAAAGRYLGWNGAATALENKLLAALGDVEISLDDTLSATGDFAVPAVKNVVAYLLANYQPLDGDLTAIAALTTTSFGRGLLALADAAAGRTALALGAAATRAVATFGEYNSATSTRALGNESVWADLAVLTYAATIAVDFNNGFNFGGASNAPLALTGDATLGDPSNPRNNKAGILWFTASGSTRVLTLHANWTLANNVETGPYSITTSQVVGICYVCRGTSVVVTNVIRIG